MALMTLSAYASQAGISKQAVSKAVRSGRIPSYDAQGRPLPADHSGTRFINAAEADHIRGATVRVDPSAEQPVAIDRPAVQSAPDELGDLRSSDPSYAKARTQVAISQNALLEIKLQQERGELLQKEAVLAALLSAGRSLARRLQGLVGFVDELLALGLEKGPIAARRALEARIRNMQEEMVEDLSAAAQGKDIAVEDEPNGVP